MTDKKLSIVVSVYNEEEVLFHFKQRIEVILEQLKEKNHWEYEVLFVNDGSKYESPAILDQFAKSHSWI